MLCAVVGAVAAIRLDGPGQATASVRHGLVAIHLPGEHWVAGWGASPQAPIAANLSARGFEDQTVRQVIFSSAGGAMVRVRLSNAFGAEPVRIAAASIALQGSGAEVVPGTLRALSFAGRRAVAIPAGRGVASDPVALRVHPGTHLAVSLYFAVPSGPVTQHTQARQLNWVAAGARTLDTSAAAFFTQTQSWYLLSGLDVLVPRRDRGAVVALGDSITDGVGAPLDANARYPNDLARRFAARPGATLSVVDEGIGGNRVLNATECCGEGAVARFRRDVLGQPGVRDVILLEGVNDIGQSQSRGPLTAPHTAISALHIVDGYERIIAMAHAAGLRIFGATLTPFHGARYWTPAGEAKREAVNTWIRTSAAFDGVIDFAAAVAQPGDPEQLAPPFDSGDHLHPNAAGYRAMARAVNLAALVRASG
ncbi:MAG TPA: SGNH/GDSL hydrolase family protein [Solirubrobacteraceae bacterium]|nr:SGNH/GDSL hydrolase family protein [Solirubrobacteraceae bacterium]